MADFVEKEKRNNPLSFLPLSFPRERVGGGERERGEGEREIRLKNGERKIQREIEYGRVREKERFILPGS